MNTEETKLIYIREEINLCLSERELFSFFPYFNLFLNKAQRPMMRPDGIKKATIELGR